MKSFDPNYKLLDEMYQDDLKTFIVVGINSVYLRIAPA